MSSRLGPAVTVQEMVEPGVEMALGVAQDSQFGPLVMVAAGGVLIETFGDRRLALPPLDEARASRLIDRLDARPLLDGVRGAPPADVAALATALADSPRWPWTSETSSAPSTSTLSSSVRADARRSTPWSNPAPSHQRSALRNQRTRR